MPLNANKVPFAGGDFVQQEVLEAGVYPARLVQVVDMGLQNQPPWQGQERPPAYQIGLTYELVDEFMKDEDGNELEDKPRWVSEIINLYSLESDRAKSTQRYFALDPEQEFEGDFSQLVNTPCNIALVVSEGKKGPRNYVGSVATMRPKDAAKCPELKNECKVFSLDEPDLEIFNKLPEWIREKIKENLEYHGSPLEALLSGVKNEKPAKKQKEKDPEFDVEEGEIPY